jgi:ribosomal protein S18 acetylase RimI-like enzyme
MTSRRSSPRRSSTRSSRADPPAVRVVAVRRRAELADATLAAAADLLADLVRQGAALGWVDPPGADEVAELLHTLADDAAAGDAALVLAFDDAGLAGLGYWRRYLRPTHRPHANLERVAVARDRQGRGVGRALTVALVDAARAAGVEQLTLDARADNSVALRLYEALGFRVYGRLTDFVAVGALRYDKVFCVLDLRPDRSPADP